MISHPMILSMSMWQATVSFVDHPWTTSVDDSISMNAQNPDAYPHQQVVVILPCTPMQNKQPRCLQLPTLSPWYQNEHTRQTPSFFGRSIWGVNFSKKQGWAFPSSRSVCFSVCLFQVSSFFFPRFFFSFVLAVVNPY